MRCDADGEEHHVVLRVGGGDGTGKVLRDIAQGGVGARRGQAACSLTRGGVEVLLAVFDESVGVEQQRAAWGQEAGMGRSRSGRQAGMYEDVVGPELFGGLARYAGVGEQWGRVARVRPRELPVAAWAGG